MRAERVNSFYKPRHIRVTSSLGKDKDLSRTGEHGAVQYIGSGGKLACFRVKTVSGIILEHCAFSLRLLCLLKVVVE